MSISWPAQLPSGFLLDGYSESQEPIVIRSTVDAGIPVQRRRTTAMTTMVRGAMRMTWAQVEALQSFYSLDADAGGRTFSMRVGCRTSNSVVRFVEPPVVASTQAIDRFRVELKLEIMPE